MSKREKKNEVAIIRTPLESLSDEELKTITGGDTGRNQERVKTFILSDRIDPDAARVGMYVYVSFDDQNLWYSGKIYDIRTVSYYLFWKQKEIYVYIDGKDGYGAAGDIKVLSSDVTLYRKMEWNWG